MIMTKSHRQKMMLYACIAVVCLRNICCSILFSDTFRPDINGPLKNGYSYSHRVGSYLDYPYRRHRHYAIGHPIYTPDPYSIERPFDAVPYDRPELIAPKEVGFMLNKYYRKFIGRSTSTYNGSAFYAMGDDYSSDPVVIVIWPVPSSSRRLVSFTTGKNASKNNIMSPTVSNNPEDYLTLTVFNDAYARFSSEKIRKTQVFEIVSNQNNPKGNEFWIRIAEPGQDQYLAMLGSSSYLRVISRSKCYSNPEYCTFSWATLNI
ncbi:hypothetical protein NEOKW01_1369 [Nematocida sp. AWRm80]|nr:hypothetical protein NEOKW01_1369 [Nematocida sp. AWRm80]